MSKVSISISCLGLAWVQGLIARAQLSRAPRIPGCGGGAASHPCWYELQDPQHMSAYRTKGEYLQVHNVMCNHMAQVLICYHILVYVGMCVSECFHVQLMYTQCDVSQMLIDSGIHVHSVQVCGHTC